jgi:hypothetical protein
VEKTRRELDNARIFRYNVKLEIFPNERNLKYERDDSAEAGRDGPQGPEPPQL